jgi:hypothetical protein
MAHHQESIDATTGWDDVRQRIARWRETRTHRGAPMPAALWEAAVAFAQQHGVAQTARALRIDHGTLKSHVAATAGVEPQAAVPAFVEFAAARPPGLGVCVIAVDGPRGRRLRLEVSGLRVADLVAVMQGWSGEA